MSIVRYDRFENERRNETSQVTGQGLLTLVPSVLVRGIHQLVRVLSPRAYHGPTGTFYRFASLPLELREMVYAFYFLEATIAVKGQPRTKHGTAVLSVNHQVHDEASTVFFRAAAFTIHLDWQHTRNHGHDLAYCFGRVADPKTHFIGSTEVFARFRNFHLHLEEPKRRYSPKHWQHVAAVFLSMKYVMLEARGTCCISVNVGDLAPSSKGHRHLYSDAIWIDRSTLSWRHQRAPCEDSLLEADLPSDVGQRWKAWTPVKRREVDARFFLIYWIGAIARDTGGDMYLESHDRTRRKAVKVDGPLGLLALAQGFDEGQSVWLVVDGKARE